MSNQERKDTPSKAAAVPPPGRDITELGQLVSVAALHTLRRAMFDPRASTRMRAAQVLLEMGLRTAAMQDEMAQLARLEKLDPSKAALERFTEGDLRRLQELTMDRDEGIDLDAQQMALARKFAALEEEIRANKLRRLGRRQPPTPK